MKSNSGIYLQMEQSGSGLLYFGGSGGNGYDDPTLRQDYTGYQKDGESGLEFAQARYFNPQHGRYTSVDPLTSSATIRDPQSFNRYSYALNSPYKFTDPLGLRTVETNNYYDYADSPLAYGGAGGGFGGGDEACLMGCISIDDGDIVMTSPAEGAPRPVAEQNQTNADQGSTQAGSQGGFTVTSALANNIKEAALVMTAETESILAFAVGQSLRGYAIKNGYSPSPLINCMAWALGFLDRWVQPGDDGRKGQLEMIDRSHPRVVTEKYGGKYTPGSLPAVFGILREFGWIPAGMRVLRVFEDSGNAMNWHVMRQEAGGTWSSKNGDGYLFVNIKNPDYFYRVYYPIKGKVTTTDYLVPAF